MYNVYGGSLDHPRKVWARFHSWTNAQKHANLLRIERGGTWTFKVVREVARG